MEGIAGTEVAYPLVAVAIDNNKKTSKVALEWAVEHLVKRDQTLVLVYLNTEGTSAGLVDAAGYRQPDAQLRELFLPYRCFCTWKDVNCKEVVIDEGDVVRGLTKFIADASIEIMVVGPPLREVLRFKNSDVPLSISKGASDFCTVYIIGEEKVSSLRYAICAAPSAPPLSPQNWSESNLDHSFEMMFRPHRFSSSSEYSNFLQSSTAYSSQKMDDVESEIRRLRMELKQTMDMYSTACREALDAKQKLTDLERHKIEEQQKLYEARSHEEAAMQIKAVVSLLFS